MARKRPQEEHSASLRVLLVEDNPDDVRLLYRALAREHIDGIVLVPIQRVSEAAEKLEEGDFDAILLDLTLPDSSGLETLRRMRRIAPDTAIVVLTAIADAELGLQALQEGAQDYLIKKQPDGRLVERAVRYALERQRYLDQAQLLAQEQVARAAAEQALIARDEFLSVISHELYTPITALSLSAESILRHITNGNGPERAAVLRKVEIVLRQSRRLERLVHSLLEVSRIHVGRFELVLERVDLVQIVGEVAAGLEAELQRSGSTLRVEGDPTLIGRWDHSRIEQVVTNLLSNAIKYGEAGPVEVLVRGDASTATLSVTDHGIGIGPDMQRRIFGRFERAVPSRQYGGLGLGLYLVQRIVRAHGGRVHLQSVQGVGSTFVVELPRRGPAERDAGDEPRTAASEAPHGAPHGR